MLQRADEALRRKFFHDHLRGKSYADIATEEGYSKECVLYWCRRLLPEEDGWFKRTALHPSRYSTGELSKFY